ncbi:hypothetical protein LOK49_LG12G02958 [Camellia lanceoleosa]|uniref:Uncharacterized protein n=1 Tax=Camellia lanceoleosa TaxID=1840588 RepID=A0ACC0FVB0_9ERIC|nr:hypothetical protein LOK49_LG12G02958 [Camellia lanceoleosa]
MGGQGNPRERNREGGMGEGRERRLGEKNLQKRLGGNRFFLLWRHPPDPDVVCADSAAGDWEVTGDFKNMSILATIDKKAIYKDPTDSKEVPPLDVPELLAYLVRQSGPFLDQIGVRRGTIDNGLVLVFSQSGPIRTML